MAKKGFNCGSPKASCDPVGHSLTAGKADKPSETKQSCRGARGDAHVPSPPTPRFARNHPNTCMHRLFMAGAGAAVRSIASEESVAAPAAHISFGLIFKGYSE